MKIHLICKDKPIPEIRDLESVLLERDCEVRVINPQMSLEQVSQDSFWEEYLSCDVLYYRTGFGNVVGYYLSQRLQASSVRVINDAFLSNVLLSNKIFQNIKAQSIGVKVPITLLGRHSFESVQESIGKQCIVKAANGIQGNSVYLVESREDYEHYMSQIKGDVLIQEVIPNTGDFRVLVIGGEVRGILKRIPASGDFRANISQGGRGESVVDSNLLEQLSEIALNISNELKLDIVGVDLIQSEKTGEIYFIETNVNPGWKGLDKALGTNTTQAVADWFLGS